MSAKDEIRGLLDGLSEEVCEKLLAGVDVYGPEAFDLSIYDLAESAKRATEPPPPCDGALCIRDMGPWLKTLASTDTPMTVFVNRRVIGDVAPGDLSYQWGPGERKVGVAE